MKKILLFIFLLFIGQAVQSQITYLNETWDTPGAWSVTDEDGDGFTWDLFDLTAQGTALDAQGAIAYSESYDAFNGTGNIYFPDNYLISSAMDLSAETGTVMFDFSLGSVESTGSGFYEEFISVYVLNSPVLPTAADILLETPIYSQALTAGQTMFPQSFDISSFAGQSQVYVVFRHHNCSDEFYIVLDDISVYSLADNADFTVDVTSDCVNGAGFNFTDASTGVIAQWDWDFGAGATPATSTDQNPGPITYSTSGLKTITLTVNGGSDTETKVNFIEVMDVPTIDNVPGADDQVLCAGTMTNPIDLVGTDGGSGMLDFTWTYTTVPAGENIGIATSGTGDIPAFLAVNNTNPGVPVVATFTVTPTNNGCNGTPMDITITVNPADDATFSYSQATYCLSEANPTPTSTNAGVYSALPAGLVFADAFGTIDVASSIPNVYTITFTTSGGCPTSSNTNITIADNPMVNNPGNQTLCGNSATADVLFTGSVGAQFDWTNDNTTIGLAASGTGDILSFVAINNSGIQQVATITVTPSAGSCTGVDEVFTITVDPADDATFSYSQATYCFTDPNPTPSTNLAGGTFTATPAGLVFADAIGTIDIASSASGAYNIDYTTNGACPQTQTQVVNVGVGASTVDPIADMTFCEGVMTTDIFITGSAGATFTWTNDDTGSGLAASGSGDILAFLTTNGTLNPIVSTVTVTPDDGTCPGTPDVFTITVDPLEDATFSISATSVCSNGTAPTINVSGTAGGTFSAPIGLTIDPNSGVIDLATSSPGIYTITYTTPSPTCPASSSIDLEIIETPVINTISDIIACSGDVVPTIDIVSLSTFPIDWLNDNVSTGISNTSGSGDIASFLANNPTPGGPDEISIIKLFSTNNACVSDTVMFNVIVKSVPTVSGGADRTICEGTAITMTGVGSATSYTWDNNITNGVPFTPAAGSYLYTVTGTTNGCSTLDQVNVIVNPKPIVVAGVDVVVCVGSEVVLTASGATTLSWNNGVSNNVPFVPTISGDYIVTGVTPDGCTDKDTLVLTLEDLPIPSFTSNVITGCIPTTVIFNSSATTNACVYSFSDGTIDNSGLCFNVSHTFTNSGAYDVTLTQISMNGCIGSTTVSAMIVINPDPVSSFTADRQFVDMVNPGTRFENLSTGALTYEWIFGDNSPVDTDFEPIHNFPADAPGDYLVSLISISDFGCRDTSFMTVTVEESTIFYIPNSFTPNGDELNNQFNPLMFSGFDPQDYNIKIFGRDGEIIFESNDVSYGWDGDFGAGKGLAPSGTYVFKLQFNTPTKDEKKVIVGHVNLIR